MGPSRKRDYRPGQIIPGTVYAVVRHIATGGMGTVYDVEDTSVGKRYVLKTLHPELGDRDDLVRRMQDEARALARLHHPNIVEVFTAGVTNDDLRLPYYVMERLEGQSLRMVLEKKKGLELAHAYHIGIDLLDALDNAHDKGVIHRDVKPDNIFLHRNANGTTVTKLLDFGIMRLLDGGRGETAGRFLGTLRYAAPEQLRGDALTARTDLYAAGLVVFEMIAGTGPFDAQGDVQKIGRAHLKSEAPLLSRFTRVPEELDALLRSALAKDPDRRPRDAFTFASELRALKRALLGKAGPREGTSHPTVVNVLNAARDPRAHAVGDEVSTKSDPAPASGSMGTAQGMPLPTVVGPTLEDALPPSLSEAPLTSPDLDDEDSGSQRAPKVDRHAPTRSVVYTEGPKTPSNGTDPMVAASPTADPFAATQRDLVTPPPPDGATVDSWSKGASEPPRSPADSSRSVTTNASRGRSKRALIALTIALLAVAAGSVLVIAKTSSPKPAVAAPEMTATSAPVRLEPTAAVTAPILAPPALDEPPTPLHPPPTAASRIPERPARTAPIVPKKAPSAPPPVAKASVAPPAPPPSAAPPVAAASGKLPQEMPRSGL